MNIEIFIVPNCSRCRYLKTLLDSAGLAYTEIDASQGLGSLRRLRRLSGGALAPVVVRGEEWWPAMSPDQAQAAVKALCRNKDA